MSKTKEVIEWFQKAKDDLKIAQAIIHEKAPYWAACFHSQQGAEKALKAAQIYFLKDFQKEHDLEILLNSLDKKIKIESIRQECTKLSGFYVTTRYPGDRESVLTVNDAALALKMAGKIVNFIDDQINREEPNVRKNTL